MEANLGSQVGLITPNASNTTVGGIASPKYVFCLGLRELCSNFLSLFYSKFPLKSLHYMLTFILKFPSLCLHLFIILPVI